ncbi:hypothetical protein ADL22_24315 [Streptomyces sp. NRRL F-4489]|uniref:putative T7SS-secreted protein n=1 Tax=Streptomyces sp. NRRL F-4489 TaxID=1609095 RepID=UPI0007462CA1|nr:hypothetical protein [Streptomyces sp. NRRL F-4489]KUL36423.1 hypothetical protein ADL22_24315 [Streptomyces sp. NRRL F-4489]
MSLSEQLWGYGGGDPYEDNGSFPGLRFNPAPGVPQAVGDLVEILNRARKNIKSAADTLAHLDNGVWTGAAADAFRARTEALPGLLDTAGRSFELAHGVLQKWQTQLTTMQAKAQSYETEAEAARKRAERAEKNEDLQIFRDGGIGMTDAELEVANARYTAALNELTASREELAGIIAFAQSIRSQHEELAGVTATVLKAAGDEAPQEPGFFDNLKNGLDELVKAHEALFHTVTQWAKDHANAIAALGDVMATLSTVSGVIGTFFPPMEVASAVIGGGALLLHGTAHQLGGDGVVSGRTLTEDVLGVASFGLGRAAKAVTALGEAVTTGKVIGATGDFAGKGSVIMTVEDWLKDQTPLGYFLPDNKEEAAGLGLAITAGGPIGGMVHLGMAFKHAWDKGSEKDAAAAHREHG